MLKSFVRLVSGDPNKKAIEKLLPIVAEVNALEQDYEALSDEALRQKTAEFRQRLADGATLDALIPAAFAAVREASKRTIGLRHYDVQLIGGIALHRGQISEMRTGEGKTLVATLPLYLNALAGLGAHLITVNDYLARRDARWMAPIYNALGLSVGVLQMASRTENGRKAFVVDLERVSPQEDQHQMRLTPRREAYAADITYGTNSEFGFDYLRDNMTMRLDERVQRGHHYAIVDEVDNVLIDEARTPLIISGPAQDDSEWYNRMAVIVRQLRPEDYEISERDRNITLTELGEAHVEALLEMPLRDPDRPEDVTHEQARLLGYLEQALRAQYIFKRNKDYLVQAGKVIIVDEFTGRQMPGRRWSDGLHQAVEAKEGVRVQEESVTYATITIQNYFRMYQKLAGMTGTALTEAEEFDKIYKLAVLSIPTNLEFQAFSKGAPLVELEDKDAAGYKYHFYARRGDDARRPVYWRRQDYPDVIYRTEEAKFRAITREILYYYSQGRPLLVGTTSVELSEHLSVRLRSDPLQRLSQALILRHAWMQQNQREEDGRRIAELEFLYGPLAELDVAAMRKLARELQISFNPAEPENLARLLDVLGLETADGERLATALKAGITHQVLNARKHTEESQIIADAGAFGAVTIATNMAGRGVDIKLGGELAEEVVAAVNRVLRKAGQPDPYDMTHAERRQALLALAPADYGIYEAEVQYFLKHLNNMETVRQLGGLHVLGSERHEARRIDNQLRGRAARQGDPGSSRFYLSLQDELMRRFGGEQVNNVMQRLSVDDALPIELGLVSRLVEQSQTRVEGANFDMRKHLLEYDDVLNSQRLKVYAQRDRIFTKDDLSEDVAEMLETEIGRRVPEALNDRAGPWKLLAWLDQVQPPLQLGGSLLPSFTLRLVAERLLAELKEQAESQPAGAQHALKTALHAAALQAVKAENEHLSTAVLELLDQTADRLDEQVKERLEALDTFIEGLGLNDEAAPGPRSPRELQDELNAAVRLPLRLPAEALQTLAAAPRKAKPEIRQQVEASMHMQAAIRVLGAVDRRLGEPLGLAPNDLPADDWEAASGQIMETLQAALDRRVEHLLGNPDEGGGQLTRELEANQERLSGPLSVERLATILLLLTQGTRAAFDKRTHRRVVQRTTRLTYLFYAAQLLEKSDPDEVSAKVLEHLQHCETAIRSAWGVGEFNRLANQRPADLDARTQTNLQAALGANYQPSQPLQAIPREMIGAVVETLGRRALSEVYRQLLLGVITELWVDYLTQMEALRVAIGLEAYAQRDPLVQYKSQASALFADLLNNMRTGVINRMFTYRPRSLASVQAGAADHEAAEEESAGAEEPTEVPAETDDQAPASAPAEQAAPTAPTAPAAHGKRRRHRR